MIRTRCSNGSKSAVRRSLLDMKTCLQRMIGSHTPKVSLTSSGLHPVIEKDATRVVLPETFDEAVKRAYKFENMSGKINQSQKPQRKSNINSGNITIKGPGKNIIRKQLQVITVARIPTQTNAVRRAEPASDVAPSTTGFVIV
ncbi:hypothetical protein AAC387_Pa12g0899 [Persea americana]